ncbi:MAG TPA: CoA transferase, partial [Dehalococcoidia bacterium]|nr:CoA transferase [Dehalococcoidia bacterium]
MKRPLEGIRILDFTIFQQGGYATVILADLGAEIIKIERPFLGDFGRFLDIFRAGEQTVSAYFLAHDRGKRSVTLDLSKPVACEVIARLVADVDVVTHNFRPGVMERLGLGYDDLVKFNPKLVYAAASGWGTEGPSALRPAFDIAAQAQSGLIAATGDEAGHPVPAGAAIADHVGAVNLALAVVAALLRRERTG